jgi:hypothetical protein
MYCMCQSSKSEEVTRNASHFRRQGAWWSRSACVVGLLHTKAGLFQGMNGGVDEISVWSAVSVFDEPCWQPCTCQATPKYPVHSFVPRDPAVGE